LRPFGKKALGIGSVSFNLVYVEIVYIEIVGFAAKLP